MSRKPTKGDRYRLTYRTKVLVPGTRPAEFVHWEEGTEVTCLDPMGAGVCYVEGPEGLRTTVYHSDLGPLETTAKCRVCGMKLHLDPNGEQPPWFERRICTLCVNPAEYPEHFQVKPWPASEG